MKKYLRLKNFSALLILAFMLISTSSAMAFNNGDDNYIIITGQVINSEYGNPIEGHPIYIRSESVSFTANFYFKTLETDESGFFYDTISTQFNYGSLEISTYDNSGIKESETLHFRFMNITNNNVFLVNFNIYMPLQAPLLQAKFKYIKKITGDKFRFKFVDETQNDKIKSWRWDFGDGLTSTLANPEHIYSKYGMYKVDLEVVAEINGAEIVSNISKYVHIARISFYHMGGHCMVDQFPVDKGQAILYLMDEDEVLIPFDTTALNDTLGYYYFYQVPEGNYCIKTQPDKESEFYGTMTPTYYGDTEFWNESKIIKNNHTDFEYHINLVESSGLPAGNGKIAGKVTFTNSDRNGNTYSSAGIAVYILDAFNNPMGYQYTDENSSFSFNDLALDTYWIYPEVAGFELNKESVELTEVIPVIKDVDILINTDAVYLIYPDVAELEDNYVSQPYPNPASSLVSFEINAKNSKDLELEVIDLQGKTLISETLNLKSGLNKNSIQTSSLTPGIYFLRLSGNGIARERKIIISR